MLANHKPVQILINGRLKPIGRGMYHTSVLQLSKRWSANRKTVDGFLKLLEEDSMIATSRSSKDGTTINICNYALYQGFFACGEAKEGQPDGQPMEQPEGQPMGQPGQLNGQPAGQPEGQPAGHKQEIKNDQEKKETNPCPSTMGGYVQTELRGGEGGAVAGGMAQKSKRAGRASINSPDMPRQTQAAFDAFWAAYPKKASKGDARKAWKQIQPDSELLTKMLTSLGRAKTCAGWIKDGGRYIPYPATWLRAEGWEDELGPADTIVSTTVSTTVSAAAMRAAAPNTIVFTAERRET